MSAPLATLEVGHKGNRTTIKIIGEIDLSNASALGRQIETALGGAAAAEIDLSQVGFMDSQGVRILFQVWQQLSDDGIPLSLVAPADSFAGHVLKLTRLSDLLPVHETPE